jgi:hypothetical protein
MTQVLTHDHRLILAGETGPKFLATLSHDGRPNVVPVLSLRPWGAGAAFADIMLAKTRANLTQTGRVALLAFDRQWNYFAAYGRLGELRARGLIFETLAAQPGLHPYPERGIRAAGTVDLESVEAEGWFSPLIFFFSHLSALRLARAGLKAGVIAEAGTSMPLAVTETFARLGTAKAVAWPASGGVRILPTTGLVPAGPSTLIVADKTVATAVPGGSHVAAAVLTADLIAYQVKGLTRPWREALLIDITDVYTAGPPSPGRPCKPASTD